MPRVARHVPTAGSMEEELESAVWSNVAYCVAGALLGVATAHALDFARQVNRAYRYAERAQRYERPLPSASRRLLIVGDSTAVGLGSECLDDTVAGRLAREFPDASIENRAEIGARAASVPDQLATASGRFDAVLIAVGGNDVIYGTRCDRLRASLETAIAQARELTTLVIVVSSANLSGAPLFGWPLNLILARRSVRVREVFVRTCRKLRVRLVNFAVVPERNHFLQRRDQFYAEDGLHPTAAGYEYCYLVLKRRTRLAVILAAKMDVTRSSAAAI
jgi:lysophospholipase L1-like esterase